jgi:acyl carrier protein
MDRPGTSRSLGVRWTGVLLVSLAALGVGCVARSDGDRETVYRREPLVVVALIAAGAVLPVLCWKAYRKSPDNGLIERCLLAGMILPPILALGFAPSLFRDRIRVNDDGFEAVGGSLLKKQVQAVQFNQLAQIQLQTEEVEVRGRRGRSRTVNEQVVLFINKDGTSEKFYPGALFNVAAHDIFARAAARGVHVVDVAEQARLAREAQREKQAREVLRLLTSAQSPRKPPAPVARGTPSPGPTPGAAETTGRVARIVAGTLGLKPEAVSPEKTLAQLDVEFPQFIELRMELEDEFGVVIDEDELKKAAGVRTWDDLSRKLTVAALAKFVADSRVGPGEGRGQARRPAGDSAP